MKHLTSTILLAILLAVSASGQFGSADRVRQKGPTVPTSCVEGQLFLRTGVTDPGLYVCSGGRYVLSMSDNDISMVDTGKNGYSSDLFQGASMLWDLSIPITGSAVLDLSGQTSNGALGDGASAPTQSLYGMVFAGNQYISAGNPAALQISGKISIEAVFSISSFPAVGSVSTIISKGYASPNGGYWLRIEGTSLQFTAGSYNGNTFQVSSPITTMHAGDWHYGCATYDGTNWNFYLDGVLRASSAKSTGAIANSSNLLVGADEVSGTISRFFNGSINYVSVRPWARTADEVFRTYRSLLKSRARAGIQIVQYGSVNVIFEGDSLTVGVPYYTGSQLNDLTTQAIPNQVSRILGGMANYRNVAASSETVAQMITQGAAQIDAYHNSYMSNVAILIGGVNDINTGSSAEATYEAIVSWHNARHAAGFKTIAVTIPAFVWSGVDNHSVDREAANVLIRTNWRTFADGIVDLGGNVIFGSAAATLDTTYYQSDRTHWTIAGQAAAARLIAAGFAAMNLR